MFQVILDRIANAQFNDVTREAYWVICNFIETANPEMRITLIRDYNITSRLVYMLKEATTTPKILKICLISTMKILDLSQYFENQKEHDPRETFEVEGGVDVCEHLQTSPNTEIFTLAQRLLKTHYPHGEEEVLGKVEDDAKIMF